MNPENELENSESCSDTAEPVSAASVDDFFRELEAREKDLHIAPDLVIEVEESDLDVRTLPDFILDSLEPAPADTKAGASREKPFGTAAEFKLRGQVAQLEESVKKFKRERTEILERARRQQEDYDNFRRRVERERDETNLTQVINLACKMLPVLDNLNRAVDTMTTLPKDKLRGIEDVVQGVIMVNDQVTDVLAGMGVSAIPAVGGEFDPELHEAVATDAAEAVAPNTVVEEMRLSLIHI